MYRRNTDTRLIFLHPQSSTSCGKNKIQFNRKKEKTQRTWPSLRNICINDPRQRKFCSERLLWGGCLRTNVAPLCADYHPFLRQGAGERYSWADQQQTLGNLLFPSPPLPPSPPPPLLLRNQTGPGLRRTEPHSALLIDKTTWKKKTAHHWLATLFQTLSLWAGLFFGNASRLKRRFTAGKSEVNWIFNLSYLKESGTSLE